MNPSNLLRYLFLRVTQAPQNSLQESARALLVAFSERCQMKLMSPTLLRQRGDSGQGTVDTFPVVEQKIYLSGPLLIGQSREISLEPIVLGDSNFWDVP